MPEERNLSLLIVTEEQKKAIREAVNIKSDEQIQADIDIILKWYEKQQHLPRIELNKKIIERILISRKGSVEQTKQKIDLMFSLRSLVPDVAAPRDIFHPDIQRSFKAVTMAVTPRLNHDLCRVDIYKYRKDVENFTLTDTMKWVIMTIEYRLKYDYSAGDHVILDLQDKTLSHMGKETPTSLKNAELFTRKAYSLRIFGFHLINAPNYVSTMVNLFKGAFSEKLGRRIHVHPTYEDLYKHVDKDILPVEYGGKEKSLLELSEAWRKELSQEKHRKYLIQQETLRSDENLRIGAKLDDELLGIPGSFKKLSVD